MPNTYPFVLITASAHRQFKQNDAEGRMFVWYLIELLREKQVINDNDLATLEKQFDDMAMNDRQQQLHDVFVEIDFSIDEILRQLIRDSDLEEVTTLLDLIANESGASVQLHKRADLVTLNDAYQHAQQRVDQAVTAYAATLPVLLRERDDAYEALSRAKERV